LHQDTFHIKLITDLPGFFCLIDDTLLFGGNHEQHNVHLEAVLRLIQSVGITLIQAKYEFGNDTIQSLGYVINAEGVSVEILERSQL